MSYNTPFGHNCPADACHYACKTECEALRQLVASRTAEIENVVHKVGNGEVWYWQGDGHDYPSSLACPVVMQADTLRALLAKAAGGRGNG